MFTSTESLKIDPKRLEAERVQASGLGLMQCNGEMEAFASMFPQLLFHCCGTWMGWIFSPATMRLLNFSSARWTLFRMFEGGRFGLSDRELHQGQQDMQFKGFSPIQHNILEHLNDETDSRVQTAGQHWKTLSASLTVFWTLTPGRLDISVTSNMPLCTFGVGLVFMVWTGHLEQLLYISMNPCCRIANSLLDWNASDLKLEWRSTLWGLMGGGHCIRLREGLLCWKTWLSLSNPQISCYI